MPRSSNSRRSKVHSVPGVLPESESKNGYPKERPQTGGNVRRSNGIDAGGFARRPERGVAHVPAAGAFQRLFEIPDASKIRYSLLSAKNSGNAGPDDWTAHGSSVCKKTKSSSTLSSTGKRTDRSKC